MARKVMRIRNLLRRGRLWTSLSLWWWKKWTCDDCIILVIPLRAMATTVAVVTNGRFFFFTFERAHRQDTRHDMTLLHVTRTLSITSTTCRYRTVPPTIFWSAHSSFPNDTTTTTTITYPPFHQHTTTTAASSSPSPSPSPSDRSTHLPLRLCTLAFPLLAFARFTQKHVILQLLQNAGESRNHRGIEKRHFDPRHVEECGSVFEY